MYVSFRIYSVVLSWISRHHLHSYVLTVKKQTLGSQKTSETGLVKKDELMVSNATFENEKHLESA